MPPWRGMSGTGQQIFIDALTRCAARIADSGLAVRANALAAPLRVGVRGRAGVGRDTVAAALSAAGHSVSVNPVTPAEVTVHVLAEVCKPEDRAVGADVVLLNKADLTGWGPGGLLAAAHRRAQELSPMLSARVRPFVAPLALAALDAAVLDHRVLGMLRTLVDEPADLSSADAFVDGPHRMPAADRLRLLRTLDLFGIAHAVVALREAPDSGADAIRAALGAVSGSAEVLVDIELAGRHARYRRVLAVCDELAVRAIDDGRVAEFLDGDDAVLARMRIAQELLQACGLDTDAERPATDPDAQLGRALVWRDYARGPVSAEHRRCAEDVVRGSLRLLSAGAAA